MWKSLSLFLGGSAVSVTSSLHCRPSSNTGLRKKKIYWLRKLQPLSFAWLSALNLARTFLTIQFQLRTRPSLWSTPSRYRGLPAPTAAQSWASTPNPRPGSSDIPTQSKLSLLSDWTNPHPPPQVIFLHIGVVSLNFALYAQST